MVTAKIVSETSAGGLWIEVWTTRNGEDVLVYGHDYFANGASDSEYRDLLQQAKTDAESCLTWGDWEGCDHDEFGGVLCVSNERTSFIVAEYSQIYETAPGAWEVFATDSQSRFVGDFLDLLK